MWPLSLRGGGGGWGLSGPLKKNFIYGFPCQLKNNLLGISLKLGRLNIKEFSSKSDLVAVNLFKFASNTFL